MTASLHSVIFYTAGALIPRVKIIIIVITIKVSGDDSVTSQAEEKRNEVTESSASEAHHKVTVTGR